MAKTQSARAVANRARRAQRQAELPTCPTHGSALHLGARYGARYVFKCGCLSTYTRA